MKPSNYEEIASALLDATENRRPSLRESHVYFIRCHNFTKVGVAENIHSRLAALQAANPLPLVLIAAVPGSKRTEARLHRAMLPLHHGGEWFRYSKTVEALFRNLGTVHDLCFDHGRLWHDHWSEDALAKMADDVAPVDAHPPRHVA